jgi:hypothetical protein
MCISKLMTARLDFHCLCEQANAAIDSDGLPAWLAELHDHAASALADAGVESEALREVLGLMLAFKMALGLAPPLPARELERARRSWRRAAQEVLTLPREIDFELQTVTETTPCPEGCPVFVLDDPVGDARRAMGALLAARAERRSKHVGRPIPATTLAVIELVCLARQSRPDIDRAALVAVVTAIVGAVLITVNDGCAKKVPEPRWGERVRAALCELGDDAVAVERPIAQSPFEATK